MINKNHEPELSDETDAKPQAIQRAEAEVECVKEGIAKETRETDPARSSWTLALPADANRWAHLLSFASLFASIAGILVTSLASALAFVGLRPSFSEMRIRPEYLPFAASILSAVVGLAMIFILAQTFYKKRVQSSARLAKRVRLREARLFELVAQDFDALVSSHGRR